ncbi:NosD domain-containing protein [Halospeciosus flavus]|uniref:NosD domain-containing protein n=1 Tax=Halospeciosus flavus TaxID=3032283 RepID=A0ABD5YX10_9EURY
MGSGHVVRDTTAEGMMVGVFDIYAEKILVSGNRIENTLFGLRMAKRSYADAVVNNEVWGSGEAIVVSGVGDYIAGNTVTQSNRSIVIQGHYSVYTGNVLGYNNVGIVGHELLPTNRVSGNDIVDNERAAIVSGYNILHIYRRNYWSKAPGVRTTIDGTLLRSYRPTGSVDSLVGRVPHSRVLAYSPALTFIRELQRIVPGLRASGIVDPAPQARPEQPAVVDRVTERYEEAEVGTDEDPWDFDY